jgi:hypothetical protein
MESSDDGAVYVAEASAAAGPTVPDSAYPITPDLEHVGANPRCVGADSR